MWILDIEESITNLQSTLAEKLVNNEDPNKDLHGPLEKGKGTNLLSILGAWEELGGT